ncbi:MAG: hypothetical protein N2C14_16765, partial [Planctomycetales bacterium]
AAIQPITEEESQRFHVPVASVVPESTRRKVERCLCDTAGGLIERGLITSGETLARVLPQMTSGLRATGLMEPSLRKLYAAVYRAFRRRRSLLLLNLEHQVQLKELPWAEAIDRFRRDDSTARELARKSLQEVAALTIASFPQAIVPNKLLQEFRALAKQARLDMPLVEEVAADIFMGEFSAKFTLAARRAAELLRGTLYETYFEIDLAAVASLPEPAKTKVFWRFRKPRASRFVTMCSTRAGISAGVGNVVANGRILEQQQILTTQNLAVLFSDLGLGEELRDHLPGMSRGCFLWICGQQQMDFPQRHARLIMRKNTAYAWRQMIFYLSLVTPEQLREFARWADEHLSEQTPEFQERFQPTWNGLLLAMDGHSPESPPEARRFLGWTAK